MNLAVIPARGGSKRIPRKNIREFCGKPMIAWSIAAARASGCFERILVSTDDAEIAEVARHFGAEVPFVRPPELSGDYVGTGPVVGHAVEWQRRHGAPAQLACCIYATAPFLDPEDLARGRDALLESKCDFAIAVTRYAFPVQRALRMTDQSTVEMLDPGSFDLRSQDLVEAFHDAGQFCWGRAEAWLEGRPVLSTPCIPVVLPRLRVQDIDTQEDWDRAEWMFKAMRRS